MKTALSVFRFFVENIGRFRSIFFNETETEPNPPLDRFLVRFLGKTSHMVKLSEDVVFGVHMYISISCDDMIVLWCVDARLLLI